jgi:membrane-associated phospholipid phosphatase
MKVLIRRSRPYSKLTNIRVVGDRAGGHSFPSGHTSQSFFMASLMSHYFHTSILITFLIYAIAFLVGITRMYVGMHYPRDVLGGAVLGTAWGLVGVMINSLPN